VPAAVDGWELLDRDDVAGAIRVVPVPHAFEELDGHVACIDVGDEPRVDPGGIVPAEPDEDARGQQRGNESDRERAPEPARAGGARGGVQEGPPSR
jgi:hypothetical protein